MASAPILKLPVSPRVELFRALDQVLRRDPVLRSVGLRVYSWEGRAEDKTPLGIDQAPVLRMTPRPEMEQWWSTHSMVGVLTVDCELCVRGTCWDDLDNLWWAVERALYPHDPKLRIELSDALTQHTHAHSGLARFSQVANDPEIGSDGAIRGRAAFQMEFRLSLIT